MSRLPKKSYWNSSRSQQKPRAVHNTVTDEDDFDIEIDTSNMNKNMDSDNRMRLRNEIDPQVFTGQAQNFYNVGANTGLSSSIPFSQSQFLMYGPLFAGINRRVLARINGQGPDVTGPNSFMPNAPGGLNFKIPIGQFFLHLVPGVQSPKLRYLVAPQNISSTGGFELACNGLGARILHLVQGESVLVIVDPGLANLSPQNTRQIGVYFSSFPVGGTNGSFINSMDGTRSCAANVQSSSADCSEETFPGIITNTTIMFPGTSTLITPTANWGPLVYACCSAGFAMFCPVIIIYLEPC
jgi:hypothetical protein